MTDPTLIHGHLPLAPPPGVPVWDIDPYDPAVLTDPDAFHAGLRERGPFVYLSRYALLACGRHAETAEVFSDHARFVSSRGVGLSDFSLEPPWRPPSLVLEADPPAHSSIRRVIQRALSPKAVADLRDGFARAAEALIDALLHRGRLDAVPDLAQVFPLAVFPRAVGLRQTDDAMFLAYGAMVFNAIGPDNALRRASMAQAPRIVPWITAACARDRIDPDGLAGTLYAAADTGEITEAEAGMLVRSLLSAGMDTTVAALGNAIWCLARWPEALDALCANPLLARPAFEEVLRLTSPVQAFCRTVAAATEVSGTTLPAGAKILCVLAAANRDPAHWPDPDRFDVARRPAGHLAFGSGIHNCVGQMLARAEGEAVLGALAARVRRIAADGPAVWAPNNALRGLASLPVRFIA
jgi:cytochrome P450